MYGGFSQTVPAVINVGSAEAYTSLTGATGLFKFLNDNTWTDDITVTINSDLQESGLIALNAPNTNGHTLTIVPSGASIKAIYNNSDLSQPMIRILGMTDVTIDGSFNGSGRYLRFINTHSVPEEDSAVILVSNGCEFVTIRNSILESNAAAIRSQSATVVVGTGTNSVIIIENNLIRDAKGSPGIAGLYSQGIYSKSTRNSDLQVVGNEIVNPKRFGVRLEFVGLSYFVDSNHIYYDAPTPATMTQIPIEAIGRGTVSNNYIGGSAPFCGGSPWINDGSESPMTANELKFYGILGYADAPSVNIYNNTIQNIQITGGQSAMFYGIKAEGNAFISSNLVGFPTTTGAVASFSVVTGIAAGSGTINDDFTRSWGSAPGDVVIISDNTVANLLTSSVSTSGVVGISFFGNADLYLQRNHVHDLTNNSAGNFMTCTGLSLQVYNSTFFHGEENIVHDLKATGSGNNNQTIGVSLQGGDIYPVTDYRFTRNRIYNLENLALNATITGIKAGGRMRMDNNQISVTNGANTNAVILSGIDDFWNPNPNLNEVEYYYNSIYIGGTTASGSNESFALKVTGTDKITKFLNNIMYNERTGGTGSHYSVGNLFFNATRWAPGISDYNFFVGTDSAKLNKTNVLPGPLSLIGWRSQTGGDNNSYGTLNTTVPSSSFFVNKSIGDLHIDTTNSLCWYVNGKGYHTPFVTADFDDEFSSRNIFPYNTSTDIGSDEFTTSTQPIPLEVFGKHILGGIDTLRLNGQIFATLTWGNTGTLPTLGTPRYYSGNWPNDTTNNGTVTGARFFNTWWDIPATGGSNYTYTLTLFYDPSIIGKVTNQSTMVINKRQPGVPGSWIVLKPTVIDQAKGTVTVANQSSFSEFTVTDAQKPLILLPVNLLSFAAIPVGNDIKLNWETASEDQNDHFEVQRSVDGNNFVSLANIKGLNTNNLTSYSWTDNGAGLLPNPKIYYRLKIVSLSNKEEYSRVVVVQTAGNPSFVTTIGPNPFRNIINIGLSLPRKSMVYVQLTDAQGRIIRRQYVNGPAGFSSYSVNGLEKISTGIYYLTIKAEDKEYKYSFIK